jgi:hypothetical protein
MHLTNLGWKFREYFQRKKIAKLRSEDKVVIDEAQRL